MTPTPSECPDPHIIGQLRRRGPSGPLYRVLGVSRQTKSGDWLLFIQVPETDEPTEYPYAKVLSDPQPRPVTVAEEVSSLSKIPVGLMARVSEPQPQITARMLAEAMTKPGVSDDEITAVESAMRNVLLPIASILERDRLRCLLLDVHHLAYPQNASLLESAY